MNQTFRFIGYHPVRIIFYASFLYFMMTSLVYAGPLGGWVSPVVPYCGSLQDSVTAPITLDERLCQHPALRAQMVWETATGIRIPYDGWTSAQKNRLNEFFQRMMRGDRDLGIRLPNIRRNKSTRHNRMFLTAEEAQDVYLAHVAHVLYLEVMGVVRWSILDLPQDELAELISSDRYHQRIVPTPGAMGSSSDYPSHIVPNRDFQLPDHVNNLDAAGIGLLGDPRVGYNFILGMNSVSHQNMLGSTEEETVQNLTYWFAKNVRHGNNLLSSPENTIEYYESHNFLKDRLVREERTETVDGSTRLSFGIYSPRGCHTASNLFHDLARSVNIPIKNIAYYIRTNSVEPIPNPLNTISRAGFHQGLVFRWQRKPIRLLSHTDDIYVGYYPFFPIDETGSPLSLTEIKQLYYDTHWMVPSRLPQYGYNLPDYFVNRTREQAVAVALSSPDLMRLLYYNDSDSFIAFGGSWRSIGGEGQKILELEKQYKLCAYFPQESSLLYQYMLHQPTVLEGVINRSLALIERDPDLLARPLAAEDYRDRAEQCAAAYGENNIRYAMKSFLALWGYDQWEDTP